MRQIKFPLMIVLAIIGALSLYSEQKSKQSSSPAASTDRNSEVLVEQGRNIFRNDTFGDQDFWGGSLQLHKAIEGAKNGGVGAGCIAVDGTGRRIES